MKSMEEMRQEIEYGKQPRTILIFVKGTFIDYRQKRV